MDAQEHRSLKTAAFERQPICSEDVLTAAVHAGASLAQRNVACSVTEIRSEGCFTRAWSSELALQLDLAQYQAVCGPGLNAARQNTEICVPWMQTDDRFDEIASSMDVVDDERGDQHSGR